MLVEALAERDEAIMMDYLEGEAIDEKRARGGHPRRPPSTSITPVLCGSSFKNKGVQMLLDAVVDYLPSPLDVPPVEGINPHNRRGGVARPRLDDEPFSAIAFKIMSDPFVGKLTYFRVYSGTLKAGSLRATTPARTRRSASAASCRCTPTTARTSPRSFAGDIAAAVGLKVTTTGDTLCDAERRSCSSPSSSPSPVIFVAIEPKTKADQDRLGDSLMKLAEEDPTFRVRDRRGDRPDHHRRHGRAPPGDHRRPAAARVQGRRQRRPAAGGLPRGASRKAVPKARAISCGRPAAAASTAMWSSRWSRTSTGAGFTSSRTRSSGASIPKEYIPAVEAGIVEAMETGVLAGFPVVDVKVELIDGSYHEVDSSEMAFKIAGSMAFKEAAKKAHPVLLEPMVDVEVVVPEEYMGDVMGDLNSRRGHIEGMEPRAGAQVIRATVPLAQMFGYATDLRSMTQGRATYTMQFSHYAEVPSSHRARDNRPTGRKDRRLTRQTGCRCGGA